ncbi:MAG: glycine betaine ABC transporter substrate-binding protein [Sporolactobacillus sp.]
MLKKLSKKTIITGIIILVILVIVAAGEAVNAFNNNRAGSKGTIIIGAKGFAENEILASLYQDALQENGYKVKFIDNLDGDVLHKAIDTGKIDLYPEYTNTGVITILKHAPIFDPNKAYQYAKTQYKKKLHIIWLDQSAINDTYGFILTKKAADKYGITNISQLQKNSSKLRLAQEYDWNADPAIGKALDATYGKFHFASVKTYNTGLVYSVLKNNQADALIAQTTDPQLKEKATYVLLKDNKKVWAPYYLTPIIREKTLKKYPEVAKIINNVTKKIGSKDILDLNQKVMLQKQEYQDVARDFYNSHVK